VSQLRIFFELDYFKVVSSQLWEESLVPEGEDLCEVDEFSIFILFSDIGIQ
jgi:hypothetical protein